VTDAGPLLQVQDLRKTFRTATLPFVGRDTSVRAVDGVSFDVAAGDAFGLVGESGSGKTTIGRLIVRLIDPTGGHVQFAGGDVARLRGADLLAYRRRVQMVFQNPFASLNPRRRVRDIIGDAYAIHGIARGREADERMGALLENVGLRANMLDRFPHQFSSGQRQRLGIARALSVDPTLIVADEPVSALDVSVQAQVLNLLRGLQARLGLAVIFISHDLRAVSFLCERIGVLYLGQMMEIAPRERLVSTPIHPYTRALFSSIPSLEPGRGVTRELIRGEISDQAPARGGCVFAPRCQLRQSLGNPAICVTERPPLNVVAPGHAAACHFADQVASGTAEPQPRSDAA
jgi:oligopeptide/dipeptide ABC transporter ATP-binding protein